MKYKVDDWVFYKPFPNDESKVLNSIVERAVVLWVYQKDEYYDYDIYIESNGKKKKVKEYQLFPISDPTY